MRRIEAYCVSTTIAEFTRDAAAACEEGARSGSQKAAFTHDLEVQVEISANANANCRREPLARFLCARGGPMELPERKLGFQVCV